MANKSHKHIRKVKKGERVQKSGLKGRSKVQVNINYSQEHLNKSTYQQLSLEVGAILKGS